MKASVTLPDSANVGRGTPSCDTATAWPATVSVAPRADGPFAAAVKPTVPFPVPVLPDVTVSQLAPDVAVHVHPLPAVTETVSAPPAGGTGTLVRERVYTHEGGVGEQPAQQADTASPRITTPRGHSMRDTGLAPESDCSTRQYTASSHRVDSGRRSSQPALPNRPHGQIPGLPEHDVPRRRAARRSHVPRPGGGPVHTPRPSSRPRRSRPARACRRRSPTRTSSTSSRRRGISRMNHVPLPGRNTHRSVLPSPS